MSTDAAADAAPKSEQEILSTYRRMQSEMQGLVQNLTKIEMERNEHRLVEETLEPLDPDRRAFRLVGGVLVCQCLSLHLKFNFRHGFIDAETPPDIFIQVERTVREVLPTVSEHRKNLDIFVVNMKDKLDSLQKEAAAWKAKYNIKTQEEMDASSRQ
ncbi:hypothetical protein ACHAW5_003490 [Stephanodiscus triporus]|uniref:Prefoldin subunit 2 n=1 Tax=Stephanodiscus triporus TaxID=2934178 RepID=A0ABD3NIB5_9STRA